MRLISVLIVVFLFFSCKKKENDPEPIDETLSNGIVVLCEGLFQQNNSSVSWINLSSGIISNDLFLQKASRLLGDTGNDMQKYGGKIYIVVNTSSTVEVLSASTFKSIKQIEMLDGTTAKEPRSIVFYGANAYVSCYDGYVDVIDTISLTVTQRIPVGSNPEGLAIANNKLYVANSGGLNFPNPDSTVSVIDLITHSEVSKITVGINPGNVVSDALGDIYVITRGDYGAIPSRMKRIDSQTDQLVESFSFDATLISKMNNNFLISYYDYTVGLNNVSLFNPSTELIESSSFLDMTSVNTVYGTYYSSSKNRIYLMDAMNFTNTGYVREFDVTGNYIQSYHVGLNPNKILIYD